MCAVAANDDADEVVDDEDMAWRWWPYALDIAGCDCGWWGRGWRGKARECGGRRDSTIERRVSQSTEVQPSTDRVVSLGHTQVWETGGVARFWAQMVNACRPQRSGWLHSLA